MALVGLRLCFVPGVDPADALVAKDAGHGMEAGPVLTSLGALTAQLHPVLHQVQRLHKHCGTHPGRPVHFSYITVLL